jgi:hypothetical protein
MVHRMVETGSLLKKYKNCVLWNENTLMRTFTDTYIIWYVDYLRLRSHWLVGVVQQLLREIPRNTESTIFVVERDFYLVDLLLPDASLVQNVYDII